MLPALRLNSKNVFNVFTLNLSRILQQELYKKSHELLPFMEQENSPCINNERGRKPPFITYSRSAFKANENRLIVLKYKHCRNLKDKHLFKTLYTRHSYDKNHSNEKRTNSFRSI